MAASRTQVAMGTYVTISASSHEAIDKAFLLVHDIEMSLSSYNPKALIFLLNKDGEVKLDAYAYEALLFSRNYYEKTDGYFDVTIGSVTYDLFGFGMEEQILKDAKDAKIGMSGLSFSQDEAKVVRGIKIDLGGMGKGYTVDKVSQYFKSIGISDAVVAASGDIRCLSKCVIDIQDPFLEDGVLMSFETKMQDVGISTSGNYNRFVGSTVNNHLINPKTKKSQNEFVSITLIGNMPSSDLDAYATAVSVMPRHKAFEFLKKLDVGFVVMDSSKKITISKNLNQFVKILFR